METLLFYIILKEKSILFLFIAALLYFCDITMMFCDRYADLSRAYKDKEKESDKLRDVLAKTQDKALRKVCKEISVFYWQYIAF